MRPHLILPFLALLPAAPAWAETEPLRTCAELIEIFGFLSVDEDTEIADIEGGCRITDIYADMDALFRYRIGELTMISPEFFVSGDAWRYPSEARFRLTGIQMAMDTSDPLTDYIHETQFDPIDAHLAYRWDPGTGILDLEDLSVSDDLLGRIGLEGRFEIPDLDSLLEWGPEIPDVRIHAVRAVVENRPLFTNLVAVPILFMLPFGHDPRPAIADRQRTARTLIGLLPATAISDESRKILTRFVAEFPRPTGRYAIELEVPPPGLGLDTVFELMTAGDLVAFLGTLSVSASVRPYPSFSD